MNAENSVDPNSASANSDADVRLRNVLVLDYVTESREATCKTLTDAGLHASCADSLEAALDALRSRLPDAVVISIDTPGLDGHALCEVIHRAYPERSFKIFAVKPASAEDMLEWTDTIPDLRVIAEPVTAEKLSDGSLET